MPRILNVVPTDAPDSTQQLRLQVLDFFGNPNLITEQIFLNAMVKFRELAATPIISEYRRTGRDLSFISADEIEPKISEILEVNFYDTYYKISRSTAFKLIDFTKTNDVPLFDDLIYSMQQQESSTPNYHAAYVVIAHLVGLVNAWEKATNFGLPPPQSFWQTNVASSANSVAAGVQWGLSATFNGVKKIAGMGATGVSTAVGSTASAAASGVTSISMTARESALMLARAISARAEQFFYRRRIR